MEPFPGQAPCVTEKTVIKGLGAALHGHATYWIQGGGGVQRGGQLGKQFPPHVVLSLSLAFAFSSGSCSPQSLLGRPHLQSKHWGWAGGVCQDYTGLPRGSSPPVFLVLVLGRVPQPPPFPWLLERGFSWQVGVGFAPGMVGGRRQEAEAEGAG